MPPLSLRLRVDPGTQAPVNPANIEPCSDLVSATVAGENRVGTGSLPRLDSERRWSSQEAKAKMSLTLLITLLHYAESVLLHQFLWFHKLHPLPTFATSTPKQIANWIETANKAPDLSKNSGKPDSAETEVLDDIVESLAFHLRRLQRSSVHQAEAEDALCNFFRPGNILPDQVRKTLKRVGMFGSFSDLTRNLALRGWSRRAGANLGFNMHRLALHASWHQKKYAFLVLIAQSTTMRTWELVYEALSAVQEAKGDGYRLRDRFAIPPSPTSPPIDISQPLVLGRRLARTHPDSNIRKMLLASFVEKPHKENIVLQQ
ncbi:hypothetical protein T439DRAFT_357794 [Meredithblackwellia eburnea MCA 4105]